MKTYGHADGALGLFNVFNSEFGDGLSFEFLATHPLTDNRISQTTKMISHIQIDNNKEMKDFPESFKTWLKVQKSKE